MGLQKGDYYTRLSSGIANMVNVTIYLKKNLVTKLKTFGLLQMLIFCLFHVHKVGQGGHLGNGCCERAELQTNMLMPAGWSVGNAQI